MLTSAAAGLLPLEHYQRRDLPSQGSPSVFVFGYFKLRMHLYKPLLGTCAGSRNDLVQNYLVAEYIIQRNYVVGKELENCICLATQKISTQTLPLLQYKLNPCEHSPILPLSNVIVCTVSHYNLFKVISTVNTVSSGSGEHSEIPKFQPYKVQQVKMKRKQTRHNLSRPSAYEECSVQTIPA